ncbi:RNA polymerase sigma factor [Actinoplanes lobatus]|uniref:RNA polymerase sigma factor n=1 Tax=Actinoplanes lobatus TaxID=113568 RepID=A0A7W7MK14_9ACTN|nr:sigma-70 family RNA polymerase sigma factor [Actinoplanes lobatus]MBB4752926.1 RNA polymerase sigma factor for flagellar operon FliA [Actinoplanes lobatus]GGN87906.1 RNA polymerase sigma factor [Actinoplanes lobatus]GIE39534.1 RNA polymerase sigma factor [Actinoplanes lobatus]
MTATAQPKSVTRDQEQLIRDNMALVGHVVREMLFKVPPHVHRDDLASAGYAALVTAAQAYDAERGIPFGRFAAVRVRGALLDELRSMDWASRSVRARARRADVAREELTRQLGRTPTPEELAELLGVAVGELSSVDDDVQRAAVLSLQGFTTGADDMVTETAMNPEELLLHRERLGYLHDAVAVLPERLRRVVEATFLQERPLSEVAVDLGVTESRVSQLRTEALALLRDGLSRHMEQTDAPAGRDGCAARRRAGYVAQIAARSTMSSRLSATDLHGQRLAAAA